MLIRSSLVLLALAIVLSSCIVHRLLLVAPPFASHRGLHDLSPSAVPLLLLNIIIHLALSSSIYHSSGFSPLCPLFNCPPPGNTENKKITKTPLHSPLRIFIFSHYCRLAPPRFLPSIYLFSTCSPSTSFFLLLVTSLRPNAFSCLPFALNSSIFPGSYRYFSQNCCLNPNLVAPNLVIPFFY